MSRKIEALQEAAAQKAQEATERVEKALERMLKQNQKINFQTVAHSANVSTAYLYKYPELKTRIITLRDQQKNQSKPKQAPVASDNSKTVMINALREETRRLRSEMSELRRANESLTGRLYQIQSSNDLTERLKIENESLKSQLKDLSERLQNCESKLPQKVTPITQAKSKVKPATTNINEPITQRLEAIGVPLNSTLNKVISSAPEQIVFTAVAALEEAIKTDRIERPGAWLKKAIEDGWRPNEALEKPAAPAGTTQSTFREWYDLAKAYGTIKEFEERDGVMMVRENTGQWHVYEEYVVRGWTIEYFRDWKKRRV